MVSAALPVTPFPAPLTLFFPCSFFLFLFFLFWRVVQGYLFVSVLLTEASEFAKLVLQAVKNDLASRLELNVCLALNCVANIGGKEMTAAVAPEIQRLLLAELVKTRKKKQGREILIKNKEEMKIDHCGRLPPPSLPAPCPLFLSFVLSFFLFFFSGTKLSSMFSPKHFL